MKRTNYTTELGECRSTSSVTMMLAFKILTIWANRDPTPRELMEHFGMSRATAFRWLNALKSARGAKSNGEVCAREAA